MAGTLALTKTTRSGEITRIDFAWTSDAAGAVSGHRVPVPVSRLLQIKIVPGLAGDQPTDQYDVTLIDEDSVDLLSGRGADRSNVAGEVLQWDPPLYHDATQQLAVVVANAGNAKKGTVSLWLKNE